MNSDVKSRDKIQNDILSLLLTFRKRGTQRYKIEAKNAEPNKEMDTIIVDPTILSP